MKYAALFTGGKDSVYALYLAQKQGHEITCLITLVSENPNSYMFHTPAIELTELQAEALELPHLISSTKGEKEKELVDLEQTIRKAKEKFAFEGLITGALFSEYQSERIEKICKKLGLKMVSPLWHKPQEEEVRELLENGFEVIISSIAAEGLNESWLGRKLTFSVLDELIALNNKYKINVAFEGGEAESFVLDCPLFKKRIEISQFEKIMDSKHSGRIVITAAKLVSK